MSALNEQEIQTRLAELGSGWQYADHKIGKKFQFKNFREAMNFLNTVAAVAETESHHPDMHLTGWNTVTLELSTHDENGVGDKDFALASKIEQEQTDRQGKVHDTKEELISEIADVLDVIDEIKKCKQILDIEISEAQKNNLRKKGGFEKKLLLVWSSDTEYKTNEKTK